MPLGSVHGAANDSDDGVDEVGNTGDGDRRYYRKDSGGIDFFFLTFPGEIRHYHLDILICILCPFRK